LLEIAWREADAVNDGHTASSAVSGARGTVERAGDDGTAASFDRRSSLTTLTRKEAIP
jgi:hypothetical protein